MPTHNVAVTCTGSATVFSIQARFIKHPPLNCCPLEFATVNKGMLTTGSCSLTVLRSEHEKPFVACNMEYNNALGMAFYGIGEEQYIPGWWY